jgi:hypothetical protein
MSNVIESLVITLGLDAEKLKKGLHDVMEGLRGLSHKADESLHHLEHMAKSSEPLIDGMKEHLVGMLGALASVGAFMAFTEHTMKAQTAMIHLSEETKMSVEDISLWQNAVIIAGGSAEGFNSSLKGMGESLIAIEKGLPRAKRAIKAFEAAGIQGLGKGHHVEITDMYTRIHDKFQKLTVAEAMTLGKRMHLDEATIRVLHKTGEEYEEFMNKAKEAGIVTKENAEAAHQAEEAQNEMKISMQRFAETIFQYAVPAMKFLSEKMTQFAQWARKNPEIIKGALMTIGTAMVFVGAKAAWMGAQAALGWLGLLGPVGLIIAAIGLVVGALVYAYNKFEGFRNLVNGVFTWISGTIQVKVENWISIFKSLWEAIKSGFTLVVGIFTLNFDKIKEGWTGLVDALGDAFKTFRYDIENEMLLVIFAIIDGVTNIWNSIKETKLYKWLSDHDGNEHKEGDVVDDGQGGTYVVVAPVTAADAQSPAVSNNSTSSRTASTTINVDRIEVTPDPGSDPSEVGAAVAGGMSDKARDLAYQMDAY